MQTLILSNPVVGSSRPDVPPTDSSSADMLGQAFADLLADAPAELPPAELTGSLSVPGFMVAVSENLLPVRMEAIGAVQGLAEAAAMPADNGDGGHLMRKAPPTAEHVVVSGAATPEALPRRADPCGSGPGAVAPSPLPPPKQMPEDRALPTLGHPAQGLPARDIPDRTSAPMAGTDRPEMPLFDEGLPAIVRLPLAPMPAMTGSKGVELDLPKIPDVELRAHPVEGRSLPDVATAEVSATGRPDDSDAGWQRIPGKDAHPTAGPAVLEPESAVPGSSANGLQYRPRDDVPVPIGRQTMLLPDQWQAPSRQVIAPDFEPQAIDQSPPRAVVTRTLAAGRIESENCPAIPQYSTPLGPVLVTSAATAAAALWQAGPVTEADQSLPSDREKVDTPASSGPRTSNPLAVFLRHDGQIAPTFRLAGGQVSSPPVLPQPDDPDNALEAGVVPAVGPLPTLGSAVAGIGQPAALVSLQELPRLAAQLAGTLVHRADGQTEVALAPEELGHVRLSMQADAQNPDRMIVMLTFERPETLDLFRRHADQLADALRAAGFSGTDISFGRSGGEKAGDGSGSDRSGPDGSGPDRPASPPLDTARETASAPVPYPTRIAATGSLDLRL